MRQPTSSITQHNWASVFSGGIFLSRTSFGDVSDFEDVGEPHRDDWHLFILLEQGTATIEIDFQRHQLKPCSVIYIHPSQVHRLISFEQATISNWAINNESLKPEYLQLLEDITPAQPLLLDKATFSIISETVVLGIKYTEMENRILYNALLRDNCNTLVALAAAQYLTQSQQTQTANPSRFEVITKAFKTALEADFKSMKSPRDYARKLNVSPAYLNECVRNTTGHPVTYHIQQRIILEAERLLYHSGKSVKEIATQMGYDDYSYFTRLFARVTGMTPLAFRNKNHK